MNTQKTIADHLGSIRDIEPLPQELKKEEIIVEEEKTGTLQTSLTD